MSTLAEDVAEALEAYDKAGKVSSAAHKCIAEIRAALEAEPVEEPNLNNPIAVLQELAQSQKSEMPRYVYKYKGESHSPTFTCECTSNGTTASAQGKNKQTAKRRAALAVLEIVLGTRGGQ